MFALTRRQFCKTAAFALPGVAGSTPAETQLVAPNGINSATKDIRRREILNKDHQLQRFSFWQNRDWRWYKQNIPFFDSPEPQIDEIYYYRWEVVTRHLRYTAPVSGYICTEFLVDRSNTWAGRYQAISGAADLHLDEIRWMKDKSPAIDYLRYFLTVPGAQPRAYGFAPTWVADALARVHGGQSALEDLLPQCVANYQGWERGRVAYPNDNGFDPEWGLFWNTGRDMGSEFNLASAQLSEELRGIPGYKIRGGAGYRPDINAVMYAEAKAIAELAHTVGEPSTATLFAKKADLLKRRVQTQLWDPKREFFLHRWRYDEYAEGDMPGSQSIKAGTLIWDTNSQRMGGTGFNPKQAGATHGREIFCYHLWRYGLPDDNDDSDPQLGYARAWRFLTSPEHFAGRFGPRTAERDDPWYSVIYGECRHNGQTWPYHTARILAGGANLLNDYRHHQYFSRADWYSIFRNYVALHRNANQPFIAESHDPDKAQWTELRPIGFHYFHSSLIDLVITGLVGLRPRRDDVLELNPLAPPEWDYFALDDLLYHGHRLSIVWDRTGLRYHRGRGLQVLVDGSLLARADQLKPIRVTLPAAATSAPSVLEYDYAVNAEGLEFPKALASTINSLETPDLAINGSCWFDTEPINRWTSRGAKSPRSKTMSEWFEVQFADARTVHAVSLAFYEDSYGVASPVSVQVEHWQDSAWSPAKLHPFTSEAIRARCIIRLDFVSVSTTRIRAVIVPKVGYACGLAQFQAWGPAPR